MLETFYNEFGFLGAILISYLGFACVVFWFAGIAGISSLPESKKKTTKLIICAVFPPFPFFWLFYDIYQERKLMNEDNR